MANVNYELTPCEEEIMLYVWEIGEVKSRQILDHFNNEMGKDWKKQTLNTHLTHLIDKNILTAEGEARKLYSPAVTKKAYKHQKARNTVTRFFGGSLNNFVAAFCGDAEVSLEEIEELQSMLDEKVKALENSKKGNK